MDGKKVARSESRKCLLCVECLQQHERRARRVSPILVSFAVLIRSIRVVLTHIIVRPRAGTSHTSSTTPGTFEAISVCRTCTWQPDYSRRARGQGPVHDHWSRSRLPLLLLPLLQRPEESLAHTRHTSSYTPHASAHVQDEGEVSERGDIGFDG